MIFYFFLKMLIFAVVWMLVNVGKEFVKYLKRVALKYVSKFASSTRRHGLKIRMFFQHIDVKRVSKARLTFSYIQTFTLYLLGDEVLNVS